MSDVSRTAAAAGKSQSTGERARSGCDRGRGDRSGRASDAAARRRLCRGRREVTAWFGQFGAIAEQEGIRKYVFKGFNGDVDRRVRADHRSDTGFVDRVRAEAKAGRGNIDVLVGLHGDFVTSRTRASIRGVGDVAAQIKTLPPALVKHGKLGTKTQYYVPHSQATYVMVANKDVLQVPAEGRRHQRDHVRQLFQWAKAIRRAGQNRSACPPATAV